MCCLHKPVPVPGAKGPETEMTTTHKPGATQLALIVIAGLLLLLGAAYLAMVIFDTPVRRYLSRS